MAGLPTPEHLPLTAQVAQLVVVRASGHLFDHQRRYPQWELPNAELQTCIQKLGVGGVILLGGSAAEVGLRTQALQDGAEIPLLIAADVEEGVGQRFAGATHFPQPLALDAIADRPHAQAYATQMGGAIAQEALAIGLNWLLAPVVDVNNNPDNPVINVRAFGHTAARVSDLTQAFIAGAQALPVLTTAKHFPGHGDTAVDSHLQLPVIPHDRDRLEQVELVPVEGAIAAGVDAVMTAHLQVPALDPDSPSTLSKPTLTG
ncbi:MAG: glycoside hydrolase family 3 N-terminal domain-containing protein, partial [Leptolyngbyaceae cyanobacterium]